MKERWRFSKEKLVSVEEGLKSAEPATRGSICSCDRLIQYTKLVLYIELILFLGWSSYTLWQTYNQQTEIRPFNAFRFNHAAFGDVEHLTVPTEVLKSSPLKGLEDTANTEESTKDDPLEEDVIPTEISHTDDQQNIQNENREQHFDDNFISNHLETTTTDTRLQDSSSSDENKEIIVKIPRSYGSESKEKESLENGAVIEWEIPFLSHIHKESGPFKDDSSEAVGRFNFGKVFERFFESNEKDESNNVSEYHQTSSEKETEQQKEKEESSFNSEEVPSSAEIFNNLNKLYKSIKAARKDLHLELLRHDDFLESLENSKTDETFDSLKSPNLSDLWGENTESSIVLPNSSNEEDSRRLYPWLTRSDSYLDPLTPVKFEASEKDETTSKSTYEFWDQGVILSPSIGWAELHSDAEVHSEESSTENNVYRETSTAATNEDANSSVEFEGWKPFSKSSDDFATPLQMENVDSEMSTATTEEEDNSSVMDNEYGNDWERFIRRDFVEPFQIENVDSEEETVKIQPKIKNEDITEREPCTIQFFNDIRVIKCSWGSIESDHSSDSSDTTESKSDSSTENNIYRETSTAATNEDAYSSLVFGRWKPFFDSFDEFGSPLQMENVDSDMSAATTEEEDNSSVANNEYDNDWEPFVRRGFVEPFRMKNVDSEEETVQIRPRIKNEDITEREPCTIQFFNGIRVMKCSWGSVDNDHSFDLSDFTESKSDSSTEDHVTFLGKNDGFFDEIVRKENAPDNTELFDENSDIYDDSVIDKMEKESTETSAPSEDLSMTSETSKFEMSDNPASSTTKDFAVSRSNIAETDLDHEDVYVDKMNDKRLVQDLVHKPEIMKKTIRRYTNEDLDENMTKFYSAMDILSAHIDTLHEQYLRQHKLEDDYISQEFPNKNYMKIISRVLRDK